MAIYADKKNGKPTERWAVEVMANGTRKRGRFDSMAEAKAAEKRFLAEFAGEAPEIIKPNAPDAPQTAFALFRMAAPLRWSNNSGRQADIERKLRILADWGIDPNLKAIDIHWVDNVKRTLQEKGRSDATINRYLTSIRPLLFWGYRRKYLAEMPIFEWQATGEGRIRVISYDEERRLLEILRNGFPEVADFVATAIDTGCRRAELLSAQPQDVEGDWLTIEMQDMGTKKHHRRIPLTPRAKEILDRALPWSLSYGDIRWAWAQAAKQMGLENDPGWVLHACRHTCATRLCEADVNLVVVQRFLGHANIKTTVRYSHPDEAMLRRAAAKLAGRGVGKLAIIGCHTSHTVGECVGNRPIRLRPEAAPPTAQKRADRIQTRPEATGEGKPFSAQKGGREGMMHCTALRRDLWPYPPLPQRNPLSRRRPT